MTTKVKKITSPNSKSNVMVCVRVRPTIDGREEGVDSCVNAAKSSVVVSDPTDKARKPRTFNFDHVYGIEGTQSQIFNDIGIVTLSQAFQGYNSCVFAYGQTGSGKTYTMLGGEGNSGLVPRISEKLFATITERESSDQHLSHRVEMSYYEIYCERVYDLLGDGESSFRVREHPKRGPYVEGLNKFEVKSFKDIAKQLQRGSDVRHTASTNINQHSSRSHAVCEIVLTCSTFQDSDIDETVSTIELVDLAGSERATAAGTEGERLKEGANINKSLLTLGNVIEVLALQTEGSKKTKRFVQYRDSTLTWLLREALGGNSKTIMLATLSPCALNYEESVSTLKYADRAKKIQNQATVNRDSKKAIIFNLKSEIAILREELKTANLNSPTSHASQLIIDRPQPYLLQVKPLPALREAVVHWLTEKEMIITSDPATVSCDNQIQLQRSRGVGSEHAKIVRVGEDIKVVLGSDSKEVVVDGEKVNGSTKITCGTQLAVGNYEFIVVDPENINEMTEYNALISRVQRELSRHQQVSQVLQRVLADGDCPLSYLDSASVLQEPGFDGQTVILRDKSNNPVLYTYRDNEWTACSDPFEAELAARHLINMTDLQRSVSNRITSTMTNSEIQKLPTLTELNKQGLKGKETRRLVRCSRVGVRVVEWDSTQNRWIEAGAATSELMVQSLSMDSTEKDDKKLRQAVATLTQQLSLKEKTLKDHQTSVANANEVMRHRQDMIEREYNKKEIEFNNINEVLESSILELKYRNATVESMHQINLVAKDKAIQKLQLVQQKLNTSETENKELQTIMKTITQEKNRTKTENEGFKSRLLKAEIQNKEILHNTRSGDSDQTLIISSLKEGILQAEDQRTQADDNLQRLSQQYTELKQQLCEREIRLSKYRESLEDKEREITIQESRRTEHIKSVEVLQERIKDLNKENSSLANKLQKKDNTSDKIQLQIKLENLETELNALISRNQTDQRRNCELSGQKTHLQSQIKLSLDKANSAKRQLEEVQKLYDESQRSEKQLREELSKVNSQLQVWKVGCVGVEKELQLSVQLELSEKKRVEVQNELNAQRKFTKEMMEGGQQKLKDDLHLTRQNLDILQNKNKALESKVLDAKSRAERERAAREAKDEEILSLRSEVAMAKLGKSTEKVKTPRGEPKGSSKTPSYMKKTATWTARTEDDDEVAVTKSKFAKK